jgi:hypothetical protein
MKTSKTQKHSARQPKPRSDALAKTEKQDPQVESGRPGGGQGRTDAVGVIRDPIRVDPEITEGHAGYDESGPSEIVPPKT